MFPAAHLLLCSKAAWFSKSVGLFINRSKLAPRSACQLSDELLITDLTRAEREKLFLEVPGLPGNDEGRVPARQPLLPRPIWHLKAPGMVARSQFGAVAPELPAPSLPPSPRSLTWALPAGRKYQGEPQLVLIFGRERVREVWLNASRPLRVSPACDTHFCSSEFVREAGDDQTHWCENFFVRTDCCIFIDQLSATRNI